MVMVLEIVRRPRRGDGTVTRAGNQGSGVTGTTRRLARRQHRGRQPKRRLEGCAILLMDAFRFTRERWRRLPLGNSSPS